MSTTIYCFSGTGNSLKITKDLCGLLQDAEMVRITSNILEQEVAIHSKKIGIIFPVFAEGVPLMVEDFIRKLKVKEEENTYVFAISNFGESSGGSLTQLRQLLAEKGLLLADTFEIKMPDNFHIFYPPAPETEQLMDIQGQEEKMAVIARVVSEGKPGFKTNKNCNGGNSGKDSIDSASKKNDSSDNSNETIVWERPEFVPYELDKKFWVDERCNHCGICEKVCPAENIKLIENKLVWQHHCELCLACLQWCPKQAIQYEEKTTQWGRYQCPKIEVKELLS